MNLYDPGKEKRLRAFRHNSYMGHAKMMQTQAEAIVDSDTTTEETKNIASKIMLLADDLALSLKVRND